MIFGRAHPLAKRSVCGMPKKKTTPSLFFLVSFPFLSPFKDVQDESWVLQIFVFVLLLPLFYFEPSHPDYYITLSVSHVSQSFSSCQCLNKVDAWRRGRGQWRHHFLSIFPPFAIVHVFNLITFWLSCIIHVRIVGNFCSFYSVFFHYYWP